MRSLEKMLFPHYAPSLRRKYWRQLGYATLAGLMVCVIFGVLLYLMNKSGRI